MTPGGLVFVRGGFNWARGGVSLFVCVFVCGVLRMEEVLNIEDGRGGGGLVSYLAAVTRVGCSFPV